MEITDYPLVLTVDEVAQIMRIHRETVYAMARRGEIPCKKVGGSLRFSRDRIFKWLNGDEEVERRPVL